MSTIDAARAAWSQQRQDETAALRETVTAIVRSGVTTLGGIAKALQAQGVRTPSGVSKWHRAQVARLMPPAEAVAATSEPAPTTPAPVEAMTVAGPAAAPAPADEADRPTPIEIVVAGGVFLPTGDDGNVGPGWEHAGDTERLQLGRRLMVPRSLALSLEDRRQAVILSR